MKRIILFLMFFSFLLFSQELLYDETEDRKRRKFKEQIQNELYNTFYNYKSKFVITGKVYNIKFWSFYVLNVTRTSKQEFKWIRKEAYEYKFESQIGFKIDGMYYIFSKEDYKKIIRKEESDYFIPVSIYHYQLDGKIYLIQENYFFYSRKIGNTYEKMLFRYDIEYINYGKDNNNKDIILMKKEQSYEFSIIFE